MKKEVKILLIIAGVLVTGTILGVLTFKTVNKVFNPIELESTIIIKNRVEEKYLDTILSVGATELGLTNIYIDLNQMDPDRRYTQKGMETMAYVLGSDNVFLVFTQNLTRAESIEIMAHELIHIQQMYEGNLIEIEDSIIFKGKVYTEPKQIPYYDRPWEIEAEILGKALELCIKKKLYD